MNKLPEAQDFTDKAITEVEVSKNKTLTAMQHHVDEEKNRIYEQALLLQQQLEVIQKREALAKMIYAAEYSFEPVMLRKYSLYQRTNQTYVLSLIEPDEWNGNCPLGIFIDFVQQLGNSSWDIYKESES